MTENFANTYFSYNDCSKIGFIREDIEQNYRDGKINDRERAILITSLLYAMDKIAKTCGHYDAYRKGADFDASLELSVPLAEVHNNSENKCFNKDANEWVKEISTDLVLSLIHIFRTYLAGQQHHFLGGIPLGVDINVDLDTELVDPVKAYCRELKVFLFRFRQVNMRFFKIFQLLFPHFCPFFCRECHMNFSPFQKNVLRSPVFIL